MCHGYDGVVGSGYARENSIVAGVLFGDSLLGVQVKILE